MPKSLRPAWAPFLKRRPPLHSTPKRSRKRNCRTLFNAWPLASHTTAFASASAAHRSPTSTRYSTPLTAIHRQHRARARHHQNLNKTEHCPGSNAINTFVFPYRIKAVLSVALQINVLYRYILQAVRFRFTGENTRERRHTYSRTQKTHIVHQNIQARTRISPDYKLSQRDRFLVTVT